MSFFGESRNHADGDKQAVVLRAGGYAKSLNMTFSTAKGIDANTMAIQYLEALKGLGASPSTKFIFPMEFTSLLTRMRGFLTESTEEK